MAPPTILTPREQLHKKLATQIIEHTAVPYEFSFSPFLRQQYGHKLAVPTPPGPPPCRTFFQTGDCPLGNACPDSHDAESLEREREQQEAAAVAAGAAGAGAASQQSGQGGSAPGGHGGGRDQHGQGSSFNSLVCKHWLRSLCKKGFSCEFLHEYNLRKMPECNFFVRNGYCSNGDECLYLHIDPMSKLPPCPWYERGFCPLGPACGKKHVRRKLCPFYLAGFCPAGRACKEGVHARWKDERDLGRLVGREEMIALQQRNKEEGQQAGMGGFGGGGGFGGEDGERDGRGYRDRGGDGDNDGGYRFGRDHGGRDRDRNRDGEHGGQRRWRGRGGRGGRRGGGGGGGGGGQGGAGGRGGFRQH
ncbi:hypothetical protein MKZ38_008928 [Zalerion maritima]|uniref:mRNA 3'-end-processing protein n=1 Tax=Zalerion maritima TaxID=339359 RepID=A0AAD5WMH6_9PEZI|nr:hypothetical protein MKZ38_008928 [Zalerion maritima]